MLVPQHRGDLEAFTARKADLASDPKSYDAYHIWMTSRKQFQFAQRYGDPEAVNKKYQEHYFTGHSNQDVFFEGHQKKRTLVEFSEPSARC